MRTTITLLATLTMVSLAGCASMKPGLGFDEVRTSVANRSGMTVHWNNGTAEDAESRAAVHDLLARPLSADAAVQIALLNNRELQAMYEELNIAQADVVQAGLLKNPVFAGDIRWATNGPGETVAMDLAQDFISLLMAPLRKARAAAAFEAAKLRVTGTVLDLAGETQTSFLDYQASEQLLEMRRTVVEAMATSYDFAQRLRAAGNNRELDVANERVMFEQSKLDLAAAEAMATAQRERMNELMGLWGDVTTWQIVSRLPEIPEQEIVADNLEHRAIERSLDLAIASKEVEMAARELGIVKPFRGIDSIEVGVAAERGAGEGWTVGPALSLPIPIFDQGQAAIGASQARLRQAAEQYVAAAIRIRSNVRAAYAATIAARDRAIYYERVMLPLRQKIVDETQLQFNAMQLGAFQLLQAKRDQIDTGAEYIVSLRDYWLARARLELILSGRVPPMAGDSLMQANAGSRSSTRNGGHD